MKDTLFLKPSLHFTHLSTLHFFPFKLHPTTLYFTTFSFGLYAVEETQCVLHDSW